MERVEEIEAAIERLPPEEFRRIVEWLHERDHERWDRKLDDDAAGGALEFLFEEAEREGAAGALIDWPGKQ